jgi:hypothetical protein
VFRPSLPTWGCQISCSAETAVLVYSYFLCGLMCMLVYSLVMGRCPCVACVLLYAGVSLGDGPLSLRCLCATICWCIPRWWAVVPALPVCYYMLVYSSVMGRCPCVACVLLYAGVSLGDGPLSLDISAHSWDHTKNKTKWAEQFPHHKKLTLYDGHIDWKT